MCFQTWRRTACGSVVRIRRHKLCCTEDIVDRSLAWLKLRDGLHVALQRQWSSQLSNSWDQYRRQSSRLQMSLSLARASRSLGLMLHSSRFALMWSIKRFFGRPTERCPHSELAVEQPTRQPVVRHSDNMLQPTQLPLEEQVFSWSYSSFLEQLRSIVWWLVNIVKHHNVMLVKLLTLACYCETERKTANCTLEVVSASSTGFASWSGTIHNISVLSSSSQRRLGVPGRSCWQLTAHACLRRIRY